MRQTSHITSENRGDFVNCLQTCEIIKRNAYHSTVSKHRRVQFVYSADDYDLKHLPQLDIIPYRDRSLTTAARFAVNANYFVEYCETNSEANRDLMNLLHYAFAQDKFGNFRNRRLLASIRRKTSVS